MEDRAAKAARARKQAALPPASAAFPAAPNEVHPAQEAHAAPVAPAPAAQRHPASPHAPASDTAEQLFGGPSEPALPLPAASSDPLGDIDTLPAASQTFAAPTDPSEETEYADHLFGGPSAQEASFAQVWEHPALPSHDAAPIHTHETHAPPSTSSTSDDVFGHLPPSDPGPAAQASDMLHPPPTQAPSHRQVSSTTSYGDTEDLFGPTPSAPSQEPTEPSATADPFAPAPPPVSSDVASEVQPPQTERDALPDACANEAQAASLFAPPPDASHAPNNAYTLDEEDLFGPRDQDPYAPPNDWLSLRDPPDHAAPAPPQPDAEQLRTGDEPKGVPLPDAPSVDASADEAEQVASDAPHTGPIHAEPSAAPSNDDPVASSTWPPPTDLQDPYAPPADAAPAGGASAAAPPADEAASEPPAHAPLNDSSALFAATTDDPDDSDSGDNTTHDLFAEHEPLSSEALAPAPDPASRALDETPSQTAESDLYAPPSDLLHAPIAEEPDAESALDADTLRNARHTIVALETERRQLMDSANDAAARIATLDAMLAQAHEAVAQSHHERDALAVQVEALQAELHAARTRSADTSVHAELESLRAENRALHAELRNSAQKSREEELHAARVHIHKLEMELTKEAAQAHAAQRRVRELESDLPSSARRVVSNPVPPSGSRMHRRSATAAYLATPRLSPLSEQESAPLVRRAPTEEVRRPTRFREDISPDQRHRRRESLQMLRARMDEAGDHAAPVPRLPSSTLSIVQAPDAVTSSVHEGKQGVRSQPRQFSQDALLFCSSCKGDLIIV